MRKAFCLFVAILSAFMFSANAATADRRPDGDFQGLVDVGGHRLFLRCTGEGSPTVVLDSGLGDSADIWAKVQPSVGAFTRICA
ncbi:MAG: hypothetical protein LC792_18570, partial [Actinobacteria bacterium]|nr:hypothetical protein [Actinomycetota bacterium]